MKKKQITEFKKDMKKDLIDAQKKAEEYLGCWRRSQADYINLKRRIDGEKQELFNTANRDLILNILPVLDNFKRAFRHIPQDYKDSDWVLGIKQLEHQLEDILKNEGLERIITEGQEFDPNLHEAIISEEKKEANKGTILEEFESGYKFKNKVIKAAKVKVAK
jgi:molecular chaperone GrpE